MKVRDFGDVCHYLCPIYNLITRLLGLLPWYSLRTQHYTDTNIYEEQNSINNSDANAYNSLPHKK
jgi:hypothetical protein